MPPEPDTQFKHDPFQRARLCNLTSACAVAQRITEETGMATVIVATHNSLQPYRVYYRHQCPHELEIQAEYRAA